MHNVTNKTLTRWTDSAPTGPSSRTRSKNSTAANQDAGDEADHERARHADPSTWRRDRHQPARHPLRIIDRSGLPRNTIDAIIALTAAAAAAVFVVTADCGSRD